jgi:hypothetical protein
MEKLEQVKKVSNPQEVMKRANKLGLELMISKRKDKKYSIRHPVTNKIVNFGDIKYEDGTFHKDPIRIAKFRSRNAKWANALPYSPSFLSYYLIW